MMEWATGHKLQEFGRSNFRVFHPTWYEQNDVFNGLLGLKKDIPTASGRRARSNRNHVDIHLRANSLNDFVDLGGS